MRARMRTEAIVKLRLREGHARVREIHNRERTSQWGSNWRWQNVGRSMRRTTEPPMQLNVNRLLSIGD